MTKTQLNELSFDDAIRILTEEVNTITTEDTLKDFVKFNIDNDNLYLAIHVLNSMDNDPDFGEVYYWDYDYSMGTLDRPSSIVNKEDLEIYLEE